MMIYNQMRLQIIYTQKIFVILLPPLRMRVSKYGIGSLNSYMKNKFVKLISKITIIFQEYHQVVLGVIPIKF